MNNAPSLSAVSPDRFYYIYDPRAARAVVMDRRTGAEYDWTDDPRAALLRHAERTGGPDVLRRFARWCARQTGAASAADGSDAARVWDAASTAETEDARAEARTALEPLVVRAATLGLPAGQPEAAQVLTAFACLHPHARTAATDAAHMADRHADLTATPPSPSAMRQAQVNWVLDWMGREA